MSIYTGLVGYGPRAERGEKYYCISLTGYCWSMEAGDSIDEERYKMGNYFLNEEEAMTRAFVESLSRKLHQFSDYCAQSAPLMKENDSDETIRKWYYIIYDTKEMTFRPAFTWSHMRNWETSYFAREEDCIRAIKEIVEPMNDDFAKARCEMLARKAEQNK